MIPLFVLIFVLTLTTNTNSSVIPQQFTMLLTMSSILFHPSSMTRDIFGMRNNFQMIAVYAPTLMA